MRPGGLFAYPMSESIPLYGDKTEAIARNPVYPVWVDSRLCAEVPSSHYILTGLQPDTAYMTGHGVQDVVCKDLTLPSDAVLRLARCRGLTLDGLRTEDTV